MKQWQPVPNGYNTGRLDNFEIQIGLDSGLMHVYNIRRNRDFWSVRLPEEIALCYLVEVPDPPRVQVPEEVAETMRKLIEWSLSFVNKEDTDARLRRALAWLAEQEASSE